MESVRETLCSTNIHYVGHEFGRFLADMQAFGLSRMFGQRPRHVPLCDGTPEGPLAWGDGNLPLADNVNELRAEGYRGSYSFEFTAQAYWLGPLSPLARSTTVFEVATAAGEAKA